MTRKIKTTIEVDVVLEYEQIADDGQCEVYSCTVGYFSDSKFHKAVDILGALSDTDRSELTAACEDDLRELKELGEA